jgi:hypothetical protein
MTSENPAYIDRQELNANRFCSFLFGVGVASALFLYVFGIGFEPIKREAQARKAYAAASEDKPLRVQVEFVNAKDAAAFSTVAPKSEALGKAIDTYARKTNKESRKDFAEPLEPMLCWPQQHATSKNQTERN